LAAPIVVCAENGERHSPCQLLCFDFLSLSSLIPIPVAYPRKTTTPASQSVHATKATVKWSRTARRQRCSVQARPHLTDFLASFWNSPTDLCVSHFCWHCVACIALPQADANTFFITSRPTARTWRRLLFALRQAPAFLTQSRLLSNRHIRGTIQQYDSNDPRYDSNNLAVRLYLTLRLQTARLLIEADFSDLLPAFAKTPPDRQLSCFCFT
jgi:hypothetical protein